MPRHRFSPDNPSIAGLKSLAGIMRSTVVFLDDDVVTIFDLGGSPERDEDQSGCGVIEPSVILESLNGPTAFHFTAFYHF